MKCVNPEIGEWNETVFPAANLSFVSVAGCLTHYIMEGPVSSPVVVLVPGMSVPMYIWDPTRAYLVKEGYRVLSYDLPGRGYSQPVNGEYNKDFYRNHLLQMLEQLNLVGKMYFIGLSFGGLVVADFVERCPHLVRKAVFIGPMAEMPRLFLRGVLDQLFRIFPRAIAKRQANDFKHPENFPNWVNLYEKQMRRKGFREAIISTLYNYQADIDVYVKIRNRLDSLMTIYGEDDRTISAKDIAAVKAALPGTFVSIPNSAHLPHLEVAQATNLVLRNFFSRS